MFFSKKGIQVIRGPKKNLSNVQERFFFQICVLVDDGNKVNSIKTKNLQVCKTQKFLLILKPLGKKP
jgi:hypothetical protein